MLYNIRLLLLILKQLDMFLWTDPMICSELLFNVPYFGCIFPNVTLTGRPVLSVACGGREAGGGTAGQVEGFV